MSELIANWTKLCIGVCAIIVTVGYVTGHVSMSDLQVISTLLLGGHALTSGLSK